jgi:hypothetical protein
LNSQRSRVAECGSDVVGDLILGREVDLLEELGSDRKATRRPHPLQCRVCVVMVVMKIVSAVHRIGASMVLLDIWISVVAVAVGGHLDLVNIYSSLLSKYPRRVGQTKNERVARPSTEGKNNGHSIDLLYCCTTRHGHGVDRLDRSFRWEGIPPNPLVRAPGRRLQASRLSTLELCGGSGSSYQNQRQFAAI